MTPSGASTGSVSVRILRRGLRDICMLTWSPNLARSGCLKCKIGLKKTNTTPWNVRLSPGQDDFIEALPTPKTLYNSNYHEAVPFLGCNSPSFGKKTGTFGLSWHDPRSPCGCAWHSKYYWFPPTMAKYSPVPGVFITVISAPPEEWQQCCFLSIFYSPSTSKWAPRQSLPWTWIHKQSRRSRGYWGKKQRK